MYPSNLGHDENAIAYSLVTPRKEMNVGIARWLMLPAMDLGGEGRPRGRRVLEPPSVGYFCYPLSTPAKCPSEYPRDAVYAPIWHIQPVSQVLSFLAQFRLMVNAAGKQIRNKV